jgi:putative addiction module component (TIGR02574 family)
MSTAVKDLIERAMQLPAKERAQLADELVESLDAETLTELDKKWIAEAKRRRDEVRNGYAQTIPGPEALQRVRDSIKK